MRISKKHLSSLFSTEGDDLVLSEMLHFVTRQSRRETYLQDPKLEEVMPGEMRPEKVVSCLEKPPSSNKRYPRKLGDTAFGGFRRSCVVVAACEQCNYQSDDDSEAVEVAFNGGEELGNRIPSFVYSSHV